jgi:type VI secretion system Hcp family effector
MAFNAYLLFHPKNDDIKGESTSHLFEGKGAIEVADYNFAAAMPVTASRSDGGGATVGRANFEAFTCNKNIDTATPKLVEYCCTGKNIDKICMHLFRAGGEDETGTVKYAMVVFRHCVITKVGVSGSGEELPKEALEFNYGVCEYHYQETDHKTGLKAAGKKPLKYGWSTVNNRAWAEMENFE